ncbi:MAG: type II toxin-antitoxin system antitoxin SocA domain-containing protein [Patescibacteria group bacterium]
MPTTTQPGSDKVLQVANYFVKKNQEEPDKGLDSKKLQKLLYYAQAWSLVLRKKEMFPDKIEAWIHGPAIYKVWDTFKAFDFKANHPEIKDSIFTSLKKEDFEFLDKIWNLYGKFDGDYLEALTHNELPWQEARKEVGSSDRSQNIITPESMQSYYGKRLTEAEQRTA